MIPTRKGLTTARKVGIVAVLIVLVLGVAYLASPLSTGGGKSTTSSLSAGSSSSAVAGNEKIIGLLSLFGNFSQMKIWTASFDHGEAAAAPPTEQHNYSYVVLGKALLNSTQHIKVRFSEAGGSNDVIAWFNSQGGVDRADVLGIANFTGNLASFYSQKYISALSVVGLSNNASLLPPLSRTSQNTMNIGPIQTVVTTYQLAAPTPPYTNVTIRYATIPGTNVSLLVYLDESTSDLMETTIQVTSITK